MKDVGAEQFLPQGVNKEEVNLWKLYMQMIHSVGVGDTEAWIQLDLSMTQMKILMLLNTRGDMTISMLAEHMGTSLSSMTGILDRLEALDFVERLPSEQDRRSIYVQLTGKAKLLFQRLMESGYEKLKRAITHMSEEEKQTVEQGVGILVRALRQAAIK
ncbi:MarR family transcriptional regulator [Microbacteriaceae bacterium 4G12]